LAAAASTFTGCSSANYDPTTSLGKQAILDSVTLKLTSGDCSGAVAQLTPLYNSVNTDNDVRSLMASVDGCAAGMNFFKFLGDIALKGSALASGGIFGFAAVEFPSVFTDDRAEAAQAAEDALESIYDPGTVVLLSEEFNTKTFNPGVYNVNSRLNTANAYLFFISLAAIGSIETRYNTPTSTGSPSTSPPVPWTSATAVTADGCAYGSAIVNFADSLGVLAGALPGDLGTTIAGIQSVFQTAIYDACNAGCTGSLIVGGVPVPSNSGCSLSACANCPMTLRDRTSCTATNTDPNSCAVAGIVNVLVNSGTALGWQ
jgi:hypothetical protein